MTPTPIVLASFESAWCKDNVDQVLAKADSLGMIAARLDSSKYTSLDELKADIHKNNVTYGWPRWHDQPESIEEVKPLVLRWVASSRLAEVCRAAYNER